VFIGYSSSIFSGVNLEAKSLFPLPQEKQASLLPAQMVFDGRDA
jgi:hypothetical protein